MAKNKLIFTLFGFLLLLTGCNHDDNGSSEELVGMRFAASPAALEVRSGSRSAGDALPEGTPVTVTAYRRTVPTEAAVPASAKSTTNSYTVAANGSLTGDMMYLLSGYTYDFYAVANAPGALTAGVMTGIVNGADFMVGTTLAVNVTPSVTAEVSFTLEHLCSQIVFQGYSSPLATSVESFSVESVTMSGISKTASLTLDPAAATQALVPTGADGEYVMTGFSTAVAKTDPETDFFVEGTGVVLPCEEKYIGMTINFMVNGLNTVVFADQVKIPDLLPGCSYIFVLELEDTEVRLNLLNVEAQSYNLPWNYTEWLTEMGSKGVMLTLGSWNVISWNAGMGVNGSALTLGNWKQNDWKSSMGDPETFPGQQP